MDGLFHLYPKLLPDIQSRILCHSKVGRKVSKELQEIVQSDYIEEHILDSITLQELKDYLSDLPSVLFVITSGEPNDDEIKEEGLSYSAELDLFQRLKNDYSHDESKQYLYRTSFETDSELSDIVTEGTDVVWKVEYASKSQIIYFDLICISRILGKRLKELCESINFLQTKYTLQYLDDMLENCKVPVQFMYLYYNARLLNIDVKEETQYIDKDHEFNLNDPQDMDRNKLIEFNERLYPLVRKRVIQLNDL